jgi:hypothetical protein
MKTKQTKPFNIYVCHCADNTTYFGYYVNAKRRVFARANDDNMLEVVRCLTTNYLAEGRPYVFKGDRLTADEEATLRSVLPAASLLKSSFNS